MLKFFDDVADNIRVIENITNELFSICEIDGFDTALLDSLFEERLVHISKIEKWLLTDSGKEIVTKYEKEWKQIFEAFMQKDLVLIQKLKQINLSHKNTLKGLYKSKSILIYSRNKTK